MSNKDNKKNNIIYYILSAFIILIVALLLTFNYFKKKDKDKPELGEINNPSSIETESNIDQSLEGKKESNEPNDENNTNESSEVNETNEVINNIETNDDEYIASQITKAVGNMVSNAIITEKYWNSQTNDDIIKTALNNNKVEVDFDYNSEGMNNQLMVGPNTSIPLPVIEAKPVDKIKEFNANNMIKGYEVTKVDDNEYSAKLRLIKCEVPTDYGMNLRSLHSLTKQVLNEYEVQGTLDEHTYDEIEELKLIKQDNVWKVKFVNPTWYIAKGESK